MVIHTSRFGAVSITSEDVIQFPEGVLGFNQLRRFVILDDPNDDIFAWLQSCENANVAFPLLEPELFVSAYNVQLTKHDLEVLHVATKEGLRYFNIITIPQDPTLMTANLKAPVVINVEKRLARQCVLQDNGLAIREPIFARLQQRVVQNPSQTIKNQSISIDVAVRVQRQPEAEG